MIRTSPAARIVVALALLALAACSEKTENGRPAAKAADNTAVNTRDRAESAVTPPDQKENETDLRIAQEIRKAVVGDDTLSFNAKNVKIVSSGSVVTLRGPVKDDVEKRSIESKAKAVTGVLRVDNQLQIAP